jgi:predicted DNA-binding transcriptional regulator YafY
LRAFDVDRRRYADFVLNRIESATVEDSTADVQVLRAQDLNWHTRVDLELVPHPSLIHPKTIAIEYGMSDGVLRLQARAALASYLLRRWNVDCTTDHSLDGPEYLLWLKNADELSRLATAYQLNLTIAPGFGHGAQEHNMEASDAKTG